MNIIPPRDSNSGSSTHPPWPLCARFCRRSNQNNLIHLAPNQRNSMFLYAYSANSTHHLLPLPDSKACYHPLPMNNWLHSFNLQAHYTKTTTHNHCDQTPISSMDPNDLNSSDELVCTPKRYLPHLTQSHSQLHARTPTSHTIQPNGTCHQLTTNSSQIELNQPASKSPTLEFSLWQIGRSQNPTPNLLDRHRLTSRRQVLPPWCHHRSDYNPPRTPNHQDTHLLLLP